MKIQDKAILEVAKKCLRDRSLRVFTETIKGTKISEIAKMLKVSEESVRLEKIKASGVLEAYIDDMLHIEYITREKKKLEAELKALKTIRGETTLHPLMIERIDNQDFSERTLNVLNNAMPHATMADLVKTINRKGYDYIRTFKGCGDRAINEIRDYIKYHGL